MKQTRLFKKLTQIGLAIAVLGVGLVFMVPEKAFAAPGLCYDAFAGVTYKCPADPGDFKVEGGKKFNMTKCYAFSDPAKGWELADCNATPFQQTNVSTAPINSKPQAAAPGAQPTAAGKCPVELTKTGGCDIVARYINPLITFLSAIVGLVVTISIVIGGIQYASARDNPQAIGAAKKRITNALIGFLGYSLLWWFLQWVIPGGLLNG